jgi:quercetin dioxygenase-like cupin family protein
MTDRPYIVYPDTAKLISEAGLEQIVIKGYINEPGLLSFGTVDFVPGWFVAPHSHHTWELIIVGDSSEGPGYTFFDGHWWRVKPGSCVFVPKGYTHCWSAGNKKGFKMLWIYPASHEAAGRVWDGDPKTFRAITPEEESNALVWTEETARSVLDSNLTA